MLRILFSLLCKIIFFLLVLFTLFALDVKGIINTLKKGIKSAMEFSDLAAFTFAA